MKRLAWILAAAIGATSCDDPGNSSLGASEPAQPSDGLYLRDDPRAALPQHYRDVPNLPRPRVSRSKSGPREPDTRYHVRDVATGAVEARVVAQPATRADELDFHGFEGEVAARAEALASAAPQQDDSHDKRITGSDDRIRVHNTVAWPSRAMVKIMVTFPGTKPDGSPRQYGCSGTLIGQRTVLTAGHCLFDHTNGWGWANFAEVFPGLDYTYMPFGLARSSRFTVSTRFLDGDYDRDLGVITLDRRLGDSTGWMEMEVLDDNATTGQPAIIFGYPGDKPAGKEQWLSIGLVTNDAGDETCYYSSDVVEGNSGSGVLGNRSIPFAVDSADVEDPWCFGCIKSQGVIITPSSASWIRDTMAQDLTRSELAVDQTNWAPAADGRMFSDTAISMVRGALGTAYDAFWVFRSDDGSNDVHTLSERANATSPSYASYSLGGSVIGDVVAISRKAGVIDLFATRDDNRLITKAYTSSTSDALSQPSKWSPSQADWWELAGPASVDTPTVYSTGPNNLEVFIRRSDNGISHITWNGSGWSAWESLGGTAEGKVAVISLFPNTLDVFIQGTDGAIYTKSWNGSAWAPGQTRWQSLGGARHMGQPVVASLSSSRLDLFSVEHTTHQAFVKSWIQGTGWSDWVSLSDTARFVGPLVVLPEQNRMWYDIVALGDNRTVYTAFWQRGSAPPTSWQNRGGTMVDIAAVSGGGRIDILARDNIGLLRKRRL